MGHGSLPGISKRQCSTPLTVLLLVVLGQNLCLSILPEPLKYWAGSRKCHSHSGPCSQLTGLPSTYTHSCPASLPLGKPSVVPAVVPLGLGRLTVTQVRALSLGPRWGFLGTAALLLGYCQCWNQCAQGLIGLWCLETG